MDLKQLFATFYKVQNTSIGGSGLHYSSTLVNGTVSVPFRPTRCVLYGHGLLDRYCVCLLLERCTKSRQNPAERTFRTCVIVFWFSTLRALCWNIFDEYTV